MRIDRSSTQMDVIKFWIWDGCDIPEALRYAEEFIGKDRFQMVTPEELEELKVFKKSL